MYHFFFNDSCDKMLPMLCLLLRMAPQHLLGLSIVEEKDLVSVEETECNREMWPHGMLFTESRSNRTEASEQQQQPVKRCHVVQLSKDETQLQPASLCHSHVEPFFFFFLFHFRSSCGAAVFVFQPFMFFTFFLIVICAHRAPCRTGYHIRDY